MIVASSYERSLPLHFKLEPSLHIKKSLLEN